MRIAEYLLITPWCLPHTLFLALYLQSLHCFMLKLPLKLYEQWQKARAKQPISPDTDANTQTSIPTTQSWRVQVILGIPQAGDDSIHFMPGVRSRYHLGPWAVNPSSSKYQPQQPLLVLPRLARYQQSPHQSYGTASAQEPPLSNPEATQAQSFSSLWYLELCCSS